MNGKKDTNASSEAMLQYPSSDDSAAWSVYWHALNQGWRTEPEIDKERQQHLLGCLRTLPQDEPDMYPFLYERLTRADVEWLLTNERVDKEEYWSRFQKILSNKESLQRYDRQTLVKFRQEIYHVAVDRQLLDLRGADLRNIVLSGLGLRDVRLEDAILTNADLRGTFLWSVHLERADLSNAHLEKTCLRDAHLEGAKLNGAHLERADLRDAHLEGVELVEAHLEGAILNGAFFDGTTSLEGIYFSNKMHGSVMLDMVHWDDVDLAVVNWTQVKILGDEQWVKQLKVKYAKELKKVNATKKKEYKIIHQKVLIREYQRAARANRRLALVLQEQGLTSEATSFAYRTQVLQRIIFGYQRKLGAYLLSMVLAVLSGYGYKPGRSFFAYLFIISFFMTLYHTFGIHIAWNEAFIVSMGAFHGRGFFPGTFSASDPLAFASAIEAFIGLLIEVTFIATLTQRLFGK